MNSTLVSEIYTDLDHSQVALQFNNETYILVVKGLDVRVALDNYLLIARERIDTEVSEWG